MKLLSSILILMVFLTSKVLASDGFVIIYGNKVQPRENQTLEAVCFDKKEYVVNEVIIDEVQTKVINVNLHRPWFKLAFEGKCSGLDALVEAQVTLDKYSPQTVEYLAQGINEYPKSINKHSYDPNLDAFYKDVNSEKFEPKFNAVTKKWPIGKNAYLIEQCFTVSADVKSFPSNNRDFVYGQKYKRTITNGDFKKVLVDTELNLTWAYCECDGNPPPTCQSIRQVTDINGNGKYEIRDGDEQPEGIRLQLQEYDGNELRKVFEMCTGDLSFPFNTFSCPNK
ncbi:MAG: hypothetical protein KUG78_21345 [Kangiellaceae bacterium]|nr:hypothetical protein [Kangiellaceae bacterium]